MKRNHFLQLIIFCFYLFASFKVWATPDSQSAITWVNATGRELLETFNEKDMSKKHQKLDEMFLKHVDLNYISKFVVGKYWRQMNKEQQAKYQNLFQRYCMNIYKGFPLDFKNKINFKVNNADCQSDYCEISTLVDIGIKNNQEQEQVFVVGFRVHKQDNSWKIIDLKLAESSLLLSYRNRFYEMISAVDGEIDWFLEDLENSLKSVSHN